MVAAVDFLASLQFAPRDIDIRGFAVPADGRFDDWRQKHQAVLKSEAFRSEDCLASYVDHSAMESQVVEITRSIFGEPRSIETECDPESPDSSPWTVVNVDVSGTLESIFERENQWYRALEEAVGEEAWRFVLSVYPISLSE